MTYPKTALRIALTCVLALGLTGIAQTGGATGSRAAADAREPACPPPGGGSCYFEYYGDNGARTIEFDPEVGACYNTSSAGAVRGTNKTNRTVHLWPTSNCSGSATALVKPGFSWNDPSHHYYSFRPIR
ncbi:hypothetical protein [Streptomyces sp. AN091965]|uniref:hypothetical protein n=1 Tax=Streptomyces sp. AN091965 TaxID=2927803 RepID=UPI001F61A2E4|nr:hypothetical protein [Streptomyces sp. AN091965]MCI3935240.1 hypothetical protein [Streptomyces sp. AN091965]